MFSNKLQVVIDRLYQKARDVLVSLICGMAALGASSRMGPIAGKTLGLYLVTTCIAVTLGLAIALAVGPGEGVNAVASSDFVPKEAPPIKETLINIFPTNPVAAMAEGNMLQVIVYTVLIKNSRMYLFNTDFSGFRDFLDMIDHNFNNKEVLILGSGGSSKAIAYSLKLLNIKYHIVSRSLRDNTISYNDVPNFSSKIGMVINTTPVGMPPYENAELPIKWHELVNLQTVINLGYGPENTFLNNFDDSILKYDGLGMLICQAIESFNIWTSAAVSTSSIYGEVLNKLEGEK